MACRITAPSSFRPLPNSCNSGLCRLSILHLIRQSSCGGCRVLLSERLTESPAVSTAPNVESEKMPGPQGSRCKMICHFQIRARVLLQVLITFGVALSALPISAQERQIVEIPEIFVPADSSKYLPPGSAKYCVFRADLSRADISNRKKRTLEFIRDSYTRTNAWRGDYVISAIDYVEFSYFYLVSFTKCGALQDTLAHVSKYFSDCTDINCQPIRVEFMLERNSRLVGEVTEPPIPILLFESIRGKDDLIKCTIKVPARIPTNIAELQSLINELNLPRTKYR